MRLLDREIVQCKALVVDPNATSRSILVAQLRDFGVGTVVQCGRIADARSQLEARSFDVVLCEQGFSGTDYSGQQLLDDLRRLQLLPLSTVFIMITSEATYAKVAEAAESALDSYLLKPHTAAALGDRLGQARRRKRVLQDIFEAIDEGRLEDAATLCLKRFASRGEFWLFAARIGAELLLNLGRVGEVRQLYDAVLESRAVPWARLGIARAQIEGNELVSATRTLETLIADQPSFVDAYDVMGRAQVELGNFDEAAAVYERAAALTPGSVARLQKLGMLSFYRGDHETAARSLDRAVAQGIASKMFDFQSLVLLAFVRFGQNDSKGLQRCVDSLAHALSRAPENRRLQRFGQTASVLGQMLHKQVGDAVQTIRDLAQDLREASFDIEAGCNMLSLVSLLTAAELRLDRVEDWVDTIGMRHCTSKSLTELLVRSASAHEPFAERIRSCHQRIAQLAEKAMAHSLAGNPGASVRELLEHGKATLNSKLVDNARLVLQKHHGRIPDAAAQQAVADDLRQRFFSLPSKLPLGEGGGRKPGGLALRTAAPTAAAAAVTASEPAA